MKPKLPVLSVNTSAIKAQFEQKKDEPAPKYTSLSLLFLLLQYPVNSTRKTPVAVGKLQIKMPEPKREEPTVKAPPKA
jgi:hypothetical protein